MSQSDESLAQLERVKYLYLRQLSEPRDNSLALVVEEAVVNRSRNLETDSSMPESLREAGILGCVSDRIDRDLQSIQVVLEALRAAYLVTEELVGSNGNDYDDEVYVGRLLRFYTKSHFLDHLARDTGGHLDPLQHYKLICLNHLIDVAAYGPPEIELVIDLPDGGRFRVV